MASDSSNLTQKLSEVNSVISKMLNKNYDYFDSVFNISSREYLGWVDSEKLISNFLEFSNIAKKYELTSFRKLIVIGMGGSSLGAKVLVGNLPRDGKIEVCFVDNYHPEYLQKLHDNSIDSDVMFLVCSKSGTTLETLMIFQYFYHHVEKSNLFNSPGDAFIAITDKGSDLEAIAISKNFSDIIYGIKEIGGRYSVLSSFGIFPALMSGVKSADLLALLTHQIGKFNELGYVNECEKIIRFILQGLLIDKDKLLISIDPKFVGFSEWVQQLIAESLGKNQKGIIPIIMTNAEENFIQSDFIFSLKKASEFSCDLIISSDKQTLEVSISDENDLITQLFVWELVVSSLGVLMQVNPFDQPDVQSSKNETNYLIHSKQQIDILEKTISFDELINCFENLDENNYVGFLYFADPTSQIPNLMNLLGEILALKFQIPVIQALGPNYLHSLGQLFKGGPDTGTFIQFVSTDLGLDITVPNQDFSFYDLMNSQIQGDYKILNSIGRTPIVINLGDEPEKKLNEFIKNAKLI